MVAEKQRGDTQLIPPKRVTCVAQNFTHVKRHYLRHWPWRAACQNHLNLPGLNRLCKQFGIECLGITKPRHFNLCRNGGTTSAKGCISFAMAYVSPKPPGLQTVWTQFISQICRGLILKRESLDGCVSELHCFCLSCRAYVEMAIEGGQINEVNYSTLLPV